MVVPSFMFKSQQEKYKCVEKRKELMRLVGLLTKLYILSLFIKNAYASNLNDGQKRSIQKQSSGKLHFQLANRFLTDLYLLQTFTNLIQQNYGLDTSPMRSVGSMQYPPGVHMDTSQLIPDISDRTSLMSLPDSFISKFDDEITHVSKRDSTTDDQSRLNKERLKDIRRMASYEYKQEHDDLFCTRVCNFCQSVLSLRWSSLCKAQCGRRQGNRGGALEACITLWSMKFESLVKKQ